MTYYEVATLVTVTKTNMIDEIPCAYGTLRVASWLIHIVLIYPMNPFWRMVTVGHNASVFVYNRIMTEQENMANLRLEGDMQRDASYWRWALSSLPPGCLWRLWESASTLTEHYRPDGHVSGWCHWRTPSSSNNQRRESTSRNVHPHNDWQYLGAIDHSFCWQPGGGNNHTCIQHYTL